MTILLMFSLWLKELRLDLLGENLIMDSSLTLAKLEMKCPISASSAYYSAIFMTISYCFCIFLGLTVFLALDFNGSE